MTKTTQRLLATDANLDAVFGTRLRPAAASAA